MANDRPLEKLASLLAASGAEPELRSGRLAPSTIYDLEYRVLVVAMAFQLHAASDRYSARPRIQGRRLKLLQFIAIRPWLVPMVREWSSTRRAAQRAIEFEESLRHGFISDTTFESVMEFLIAASALRREDLFVIPATNSKIIFDLVSEARNLSLFESEFSTLVDLKKIVITNEMLEGW